MTTSSDGKRVFTIELVRGSKSTDLCRLIHDEPFEGSSPDLESGPFTDGYHRHVRVLKIAEAAALINSDIAAGKGCSPLSEYVDSI